MGVIKLENQRGNNSQKNILKLSRNHFIMPHYQKNRSMQPTINTNFTLHWRSSLDMTYSILVSYQNVGPTLYTVLGIPLDYSGYSRTYNFSYIFFVDHNYSWFSGTRYYDTCIAPQENITCGRHIIMVELASSNKCSLVFNQS